MDAKTSAALSSITPSYHSGHLQTVPIVDEIVQTSEPPPAYENAVTESSSQGVNTPASTPTSATAARSRSPRASTLYSQSACYQAQYTSPKPMRVYLDDDTRAKLENTSGCCFSSSGGCCFSDMGGCCFSSNGGCCCSDNAGCCFSNNGGCCFSDHEACCFSDNRACCCSAGPKPGAELI